MSGTMATSADQNGWIEWSGGECPVPLTSKVDIYTRCHALSLNVEAGAGFGFWGRARRLRPNDIIAYRIVTTPERQS